MVGYIVYFEQGSANDWVPCQFCIEMADGPPHCLFSQESIDDCLN